MVVGIEIRGLPPSADLTSLRAVIEATGYEPLDVRMARNVTIADVADQKAARDVVAQLDGLSFDADSTIEAKVSTMTAKREPAGRGRSRSPRRGDQGKGKHKGGDRKGKGKKSDREDDGYSKGGQSWGMQPCSKGKGKGKGKGNDKSSGEQLNFQVELSNVPSAYSHESLMELHEYLDVNLKTLESTKFLDSAPDGERKRKGVVLLRYSSEAAARAAAAAFHGQDVAEVHGGVSSLSAKIVATESPAVLLPSVYVSDLPIEMSEKQLRDLHEYEGLNEAEMISCKMLDSKEPSSGTRCCIVRYATDEAAQNAISTLRGKQLTTNMGTTKYLGLRMAKPANWMVKSGAAEAPTPDETSVNDDVPALPPASRIAGTRLDQFVERLQLDSSTCIFLSNLPGHIQRKVFKEFETADPEAETPEELAERLREQAQVIYPGASELLDDGIELENWAMNLCLTTAEVAWFVMLPKRVKDEAMVEFQPELVEGDIAEELKAFVSEKMRGSRGASRRPSQAPNGSPGTAAWY